MREYGKIGSSLHRSRKWRKIEAACDGDKALSRLAKNVYTYLQTSGIGNCIGTYIVPPEMAAVDMQEPADEIRLTYGVLQEVGLIEYDPDEELVLIPNFLTKNPITGVSHLKSAVKAVDNLPYCPLKTSASVGVIEAIMHRCAEWKAEIKDRSGNLRTENQKIAYERLQNNYATFLSEVQKILINQEVKDFIGRNKTELSTVLSTELGLVLPTVETCKETETQTKTQTETQTQTERETQTETQTQTRSTALQNEVQEFLESNRKKLAKGKR